MAAFSSTVVVTWVATARPGAIHDVPLGVRECAPDDTLRQSLARRRETTRGRSPPRLFPEHFTSNVSDAVKSAWRPVVLA